MIKWRLLIFAAAMAVGASAAGAQERFGHAAPGARLLPAHEIITILRSTGFDPVGRPVRVGSRYEVQAFDPDDFEVRLVVDGRSGRILTVRDGEEAWPMGPPPYPHGGFRQTAGRFGPLSYGPPLYPGGLMPPRGIPARRSSAKVDPQKAPVPRSRPGASRDPAVASNAPVAPTTSGPTAKPAAHAPAKTASAPSNAVKPSTGATPATINAPTGRAPSLSTTMPGTANAGIKGSVGTESGKKQSTTSTAVNAVASPPETTTRPIPGGPPAPDAAAAAKADNAFKVVPVAPLE